MDRLNRTLLFACIALFSACNKSGTPPSSVDDLPTTDAPTGAEGAGSRPSTGSSTGSSTDPTASTGAPVGSDLGSDLGSEPIGGAEPGALAAHPTDAEIAHVLTTASADE